jgi:cell wall-associated NlpC family hydrolase
VALPGKTYEAGTAFLTVVPSFRGIEEAFKQQVRDMAAAADKDLSAGMAKGLDDINKQAKDRGAKAGHDYAGAYETEAKRILDKAWKSLPEPQPDVDMSNWEKSLAEVRKGMKELSEQRIGIDIDRASFDRAVDDFRQKLEELRDSASGPGKSVHFFDANEAAKDLRSLQDFSADAARVAGEGGDRAGSAFRMNLSKALSGGLSKLPEIKVDADTSEAEAKLAQLRADMVDLRSKRIGVNIDADAAYAEVKRIIAELDKLDRRTVDAEIRTNARAVAADLGQVVTAAEGAASSTEGIGAGADFSLSRMEYLIALGASLGTVIVPAAAAAAGAIASIGTMAAAGASGIGVVALALSGVAGAVKALNNYEGDAAKSAKSFNDANRSVASSTDQVRSAEAALANTRRTTAEAAADAARRVTDARQAEKRAEQDLVDARRQAVISEAEADRQVRDAQRAVTAAESDALDVRKQLNQAIEDAKNNMLDLTAQLHRNELDQAKAVTAQMAALEALNKLKANPRATEIELRTAQEAYDEQTVQLEELGVKHKELAEKKAKYDKEGVEGDAQVIAARKRVKDSDQAIADARERLSREEQQRQETYYQAQKKVSDAQAQVAKAQLAVADARRQQARQAADAQYQLAQASQAVTAAQRAQQAAWDKTATAGGDALNTLNQKMSMLSPAQQHFAKFLFGLKDDFIALRDAAAEPMLPQFETAITNLLKYLPSVEAFVGKVADKIGDLAVQASNAFGSSVWQRFFGYVSQTVVPSLQTMYDIGSNLTQGLLNLFLALTPFNQEVGGGLVKLSQDFAIWAEKFDKTQGYRDFLQYVQENGPRVIHFLGEFGQLFIDIVKAAAPIGSVVLRVLSLLVDVINSLPTEALTALVAVIASLSLGFTVLGAIVRAGKLKDSLIEIFGPRSKKLVDEFAIATGRASDETGNFAKATATAQGIAAAGRDKILGYGAALGQVPGKAKDAVAGSKLFTGSMDAISKASSGVAGAVGAAGDAVRNIGPNLSSMAGNAKTAASTGMDRLKTSMLEVVTAANGPGGLAAGAQEAGKKLAGFGTAAADAAANLRGKIASGASTFAGALGNVATKAGQAATAVGTKLVNAGKGLVGMLGGPWGTALAVGALAVGYFTEKSQEQQAKVDSLKAALGELSTTYRDLAQSGDQAGAKADEAFANIVRQNPEMQKAVIQLDKLGISFKDMVQAAASGDPSAVLKKLNAEIDRNQQLSDEFDRRNIAAKGIYGANPYGGKIDSLKQLRDAFVANANAMGLANQATAILNENTDRNQAITLAQAGVAKNGVVAQSELVNAYDNNATAIGALNGLISTYNNLQSTAQQKSDAVKAAIESETGAAIAQTDANESLAQKTMALRDQVNQAKTAQDKHATSMSLSTQTGLRNRDALEQVASSIRDMYLQDIAAGKPLADVTKAHNDRIKALKDEAKHLGLDQGETKKLIDLYGDVPKDVKTAISMDPNSFQSVYSKLQRMQFMQTELLRGRDAAHAEADWQEFQREQVRAYPTGRARGGPISGPGTSTSDSILVRLSDGEFVHKAAAVDYYGDSAMAAINNMQVPRENLAGFAGGGLVPRQRRGGEDLPAFAKGGKVNTVSIKVNVANTWIPDADWVRAHTPIAGAADGSWNGTLSANKTIAKMQQFALNQRGKTYLWAAVGPKHFDCSGLVGNLYAIATGKSLYHRYMSTSDMGPGRHGMVAGPGRYFTVYLGPGHTAANVGGLHAEAYGGNGVPLAIGRIGTRLSYYNQKLHLPGLAEGGLVDPNDLTSRRDRMVAFLKYGWPEPPSGGGFDALLNSPLITSQFDNGGMLPPGYSAVVNNTGSPEPVLTQQQWQDINQIANGPRRPGNTYQFSFLDTTLDPAKLREIQDREAITSRYDRAR